MRHLGIKKLSRRIKKQSMSFKSPEPIDSSLKIRVGMVIQSYYPRLGGAERQIMSLAPLLKNLGAEITVYTRQYPGMAPEQNIKGVPVKRIKIKGPKIIAAMMYMFGGLIKITRDNPDILHAHELLSPTTTAILAKILFGKPVIVKVLRGGFLGDIYKVKNGAFSLFRIWLFKKYIDMVISISEEITQELLEIGFPEAKIINIPNGVDTEKFSGISGSEKKALASKLGLPEGKRVIYSGRLVKEKNVASLIDIWSKVINEHRDAHLIILGEGPEKQYLENLSGENIRFIGQVDNVHQYLKAGDLFILPSMTEGFSNSLLEAMACELPVIATRVGGAPEIINHMHNGILISPDSKQELLTAVLSFLEKPDGNLGREARRTILAKYSLEEIARKIFLLYTQVTANKT